MRGQTIAPFSRPRGAGALARVVPRLSHLRWKSLLWPLARSIYDGETAAI